MLKEKTVLLVGPDFFGYNESIVAAFENHGFKSQHIESPTHTPKGLINRLRIDLPRLLRLPDYSKQWRRMFNAQVLATGRQLKPHYFVVIRGDWIEPDTFRDIPADARAIWFQDVARRSGQHSIELAMLSDAVFVFEEDDIAYLAERGVDPEKVKFVPMGYDSRIYKKQPGRTKDIDIAFVGHLYKPRKAILSELVARRPQYRIKVWGRYLRYKEPRTWLELLSNRIHHAGRQVYMNRNVPPQAVNDIYARSKIVLNIHHEQSKNGCNPRVFEILGSGAFQVCDENNFIRTHVSSDIVMYSNMDELLQVLDHYIEDDAERQRIAELTGAVAPRFTFSESVRLVIEKLDQTTTRS